MKRINLPAGHKIVVSYGAGIDSTAMLVALKRQNIKPDLILFANTGGEKPETYHYIDKINAWLQSVGFPLVTIVKNNTLDRTPYNDLYSEKISTATLPGIAFNKHDCSVKWKIIPQEQFLKGVNAHKDPSKIGTSFSNYHQQHELYTEALATGKKLVRLVGYDDSDADRRRRVKAAKFQEKNKDFLYSYPLQDLGWTRQECITAIIEEGLEVPLKSACYFCPASQKWELFWLAGTHPELFLKALHMEHVALLGKNSRYDRDDCSYTDDFDSLATEKAPRWPAKNIAVGLGRSFNWNQWARQNGIVSQDGTFIGDRAALLAKAQELQAAGGNAADVRTCGKAA